MDKNENSLVERLRTLRPAKLQGDLASRISEQLAESPMVGHSRHWRSQKLIAACVMAACILISLFIWSVYDQDEPKVMLATAWDLTSTGEAKYRVVSPTYLRLTEGEIRLASSRKQSSTTQEQLSLTIETPSGTTESTEADFYVGVHTTESRVDKNPNPKNENGTAMKSLTRVLVLAGTVTLSNALGTIDAQANELITSRVSEVPTKWVIEANNDFAIQYYKQLAENNDGENLFFSPYSISSALAMAAEGARGQTADEIGRVLCFPEAARRIGGDAQSIPWQTSLIGTGVARLNRTLETQSENESRLLREKVARLRDEVAAANRREYELRKKYRHEKHELKKSEDELSVKWEDVQAAFRKRQELTLQTDVLLSELEPFQLHIANSLWADQSYPFRNAYLDEITEHYTPDGIVTADFKNNPGGELKRLNDWVTEQTKGRINGLFPEGSITRLTRMVLVNAIYFKGDWQTPFNPSNTKHRDFVSVSGDAVQTPIMSDRFDKLRYGAFEKDGSFFRTPYFQDEGRGYPDDEGFAMVELPYKGNQLSMVVLAPNRAEGIESLEAMLSSENLARWSSLCQERETNVLLPKLKIATKYFLKNTLVAMGMRQAFDITAADFGGMTDSTDSNDGLYLSEAIHQTFLEVNEQGTEAVAATGVAVAQRAAVRRPFTPQFAADRPFIFFIRDTEGGNILFMGRVMDPETDG